MGFNTDYLMKSLKEQSDSNAQFNCSPVLVHAIRNHLKYYQLRYVFLPGLFQT